MRATLTLLTLLGLAAAAPQFRLSQKAYIGLEQALAGRSIVGVSSANKVFHAYDDDEYNNVVHLNIPGLTGGSPQIGSPQIDSPQFRSPQISSPQFGSARFGSPQIGSAQLGSPQIGSAQLGSPQIGSAQLGSPQIGSAQLGSPQIGSPQFGSAQIPAGRNRAIIDQIEAQGEIAEALEEKRLHQIAINNGLIPSEEAIEAAGDAAQLAVEQAAIEQFLAPVVRRRRGRGRGRAKRQTDEEIEAAFAELDDFEFTLADQASFGLSSLGTIFVRVD